MPTRATKPQGFDVTPELLDDSAFDSWETVSRDFGTKIVWGDEPGQTSVFVGEFLGLREVPADDGTEDTMTAAEFTDTSGEKFYCWATFAIKDAAESEVMVAGDTVRIKFNGREKTKRNLNPVTKLGIQVKPR